MTTITIDVKGPGGVSTIEGALIKEFLESRGAKVTINDPNATDHWEMTPTRLAEIKKNQQESNWTDCAEFIINVEGYPWGG